MNEIASTDQRFIDYLESLVNNKDRGAIANLRRGLGKPPGTVPQMDRYVLKFFSEEDKVERMWLYYLVASLFAFWYQGKDEVISDPPANLGYSLRVLVDREATADNRNEIEDRIEKRLVALLNCHRDDLPQHLRQIVSLLKARDVPVNWRQLLSDIKHWERDDRRVQKEWAKSFWVGFRQDKTGEDAQDKISANKAE